METPPEVEGGTPGLVTVPLFFDLDPEPDENFGRPEPVPSADAV